MLEFKDSVQFDPGFSPISFSFVENISIVTQEYNSLKAQHQKRFWLMKFEPVILDLINKCAAFYLGCILWGGFIHFRFKDESKEISGNTTKNLTEDERNNLDCAADAKAMIEYIQLLDRDCKYFLKRPAKVAIFIKEILEGYIEFAQINNNFIEVNNTNDVKTPKCVEHFESLSKENLDELCEKIHEVIKSSKIELLLDLKFFNVE